jgi:uncharacterized protein (TIGR02284 family)
MAFHSVDETVIDRLQDLLSINIDSQRGFEEAAENTNDPQLQSLFRDFSQRRSHNAAELREQISAAGWEPTTSGSVSASLHRWWIDTKQLFTGKDAAGILNEAERGEDSIKHEYEDALQEIGNTEVRSLVERQYNNVREGHDRVKAMRDSFVERRNPR